MSEKRKVVQCTELYGKPFGETGEYVMGTMLGQGGYGAVYVATSTKLERKVAIKVLKPDRRGNYPTNVLKRFKREAQMVAQLRDPHVVRLIGFGQDAETELAYMVFEYVDGRPLDDVIDKDGAIAPGRVVNILRQALMALHEAHTIGIIHRDLKPANLMLYNYIDRVDNVKVLDFGIGKFIKDISPNQTQLTATGLVVGTPRYMSPEQVTMGMEVTPQSDIFSLGMVAWEMLTGKPYLKGTDAMSLAAELATVERIILPPEVCPEANGVRMVVEKMLKKDTAERYQSAKDVLRDLDHLRIVEDSEDDITVNDLPEQPAPIRVELVGGERGADGVPAPLVIGFIVLVALTFVSFLFVNETKQQSVEPQLQESRVTDVPQVKQQDTPPAVADTRLEGVKPLRPEVKPESKDASVKVEEQKADLKSAANSETPTQATSPKDTRTAKATRKKASRKKAEASKTKVAVHSKTKPKAPPKTENKAKAKTEPVAKPDAEPKTAESVPAAEDTKAKPKKPAFRGWGME